MSGMQGTVDRPNRAIQADLRTMGSAHGASSVTPHRPGR
jgi:hypothetical protein